jgi:hypothetical protein
MTATPTPTLREALGRLAKAADDVLAETFADDGSRMAPSLGSTSLLGDALRFFRSALAATEEGERRETVSAVREERKRLVRVATERGASVALAAVGFERCRERHDETDQRCLKGVGHGGDTPGFITHQSENVAWVVRAPQLPESATEERRDHAATGGNRQAGPGAVQTSQKSRVHADARPSLDGPATEEQPERKRTLGGMTHEEWAETWRDEPDVILRLVAGDGFLELLAAAFRTTGEGEAQR